jgi:uncharacterized membrane protein YhaH (DUF805 family)
MDYWLWHMGTFALSAAALIVVGQVFLDFSVVEQLTLGLIVLFGVSNVFMSVRRLHDRNLPGSYVLVAVVPVLIAAGVAVFPEIANQPIFGGTEPARLAFATSTGGILGAISYVLMNVWCFEGTDGSNRYGQDPLYR